MPLPLTVRQIDHAAWTVPDLDAAIAFYGQLFGARVLYRLGPIESQSLPRAASGKDWTHAHLGIENATLELAFLALPSGIHIELFQYAAPAGATTAPSAQHTGASHLGLLVDDLSAAALLLQQHGCTVFEPIAFDSGPTAGARFQYFRDPWGVTFELTERSTTLASGPAARLALNPAELYNSTAFGFSHAVVQQAPRTIHLAGQVAWNGQGELVGPGDRIAQTRQALSNLKTVLAAAGATPRDVVRLRTYLVDHSPAELVAICGLINAFYDGAAPAANTVIGVASLAMPDFLVEIEATACLP